MDDSEPRSGEEAGIQLDTTVLGRTGLDVSVAGLGCGGHSRLGLAAGGTPDDAIAVVRRALELGVTFVDTAEAYGTEEVVGKAMAGRRHEVVLSTKAWIRRGDRSRTPDELLDALDASLARLGTDHVDVWHLHGVPDELYDRAVSDLVPAMRKAQDAGKVRFLGITEVFGRDTRHRMLDRALDDDLFDVVMVGFNVLNQSARERVFPRTQRKRVGTLLMFAVRRALTSGERARDEVARLRALGYASLDALAADDPFGFVESDSLTDAAYRFCRHEPGVDVVLTGTGNVAHLEENLASLARPALRDGDLERLRAAFAGIDVASGN